MVVQELMLPGSGINDPYGRQFHDNCTANEEGRIYIIIYASSCYLLSCNMGEVLTMFSECIGMPVPLLPVILFVNLATDGLRQSPSAWARDKNTMKQNQETRTSIFLRPVELILVRGILIGIYTAVIYNGIFNVRQCGIREQQH